MMKTFPWTLLMLFSSIAISFTGCGGKPETASMTEGVELSEIEAYEKAQQEMEAEAMGEMDETNQP